MSYYQVLHQGKVVGYVHGCLEDLLHYYVDNGYEFRKIEVACMISSDNHLHAILKGKAVIGYVCGSTQALEKIYYPPSDNLPGLDAQIKVIPLDVAVITPEEVSSYKARIGEIYQERARQVEELKQKRIPIPTSSLE